MSNGSESVAEIQKYKVIKNFILVTTGSAGKGWGGSSPVDYYVAALQHITVNLSSFVK